MKLLLSIPAPQNLSAETLAVLDALSHRYDSHIDVAGFETQELRDAMQNGGYDRLLLIGTRLEYAIQSALARGSAPDEAFVTQWAEQASATLDILATDRRRVRLLCAAQCNYALAEVEAVICAWIANLEHETGMASAAPGLGLENFDIARIFAVAHSSNVNGLRALAEEMAASVTPLVDEADSGRLNFARASEAVQEAPLTATVEADGAEDMLRQEIAELSASRDEALNALTAHYQSREADFQDAIGYFQSALTDCERILAWHFDEIQRLSGALNTSLRQRDKAVSRAELSVREVREAQQERDHLAADASRLRESIDQIRTSTSWRVTAPLRWAKGGHAAKQQVGDDE